RRRHTRFSRDWSSDVCSSDLNILDQLEIERQRNPEAGELSEKDKAEYRDIAGRRVRLGLILSEIGRQNKLGVSDQELQKAVITEIGRASGRERGEVPVAGAGV